MSERKTLRSREGTRLIDINLGIDQDGRTILTVPRGLRNTQEIEAVVKSAGEHKVQRLDLSFFSGGTYHIPNSLGKVMSLEVLNIEGGSNAYRLPEIPESIGNLSYLKELMIAEARDLLEYLPTSIGNLQKLEKLHISSCSALKEIPASVGRLKKLKTLDVSECMYFLSSLTKLPNTIGELTALENLIVRGTAIDALPETLGNLSNLRYLEIGSNPNLHCLPESLGNLNKLVTLMLEDGHLKSLPESIGKLSSLRQILAENNQLTHLPESIGDLPCLEKLELNYNKLSGLPESIGNLSTLKEDICLYRNPLTYLPDSILELPVDLLYEGASSGWGRSKEARMTAEQKENQIDD